MIICGGDEAGRGAVIGPLVVSLVVAKKEHERKFAEIGVRDSKLLTRERREALFDRINEIALEVYIDKISAADINKAMQSNISLNELEAVRFSKLFDRVENHASILYLDSPDVVASKFGARVNIYSSKPTKVVGIPADGEKGVRYTKIVSEHKADAKYPVVSAASIIAKVVRDQEIKDLSKKLGLNVGSGYPSDQTTVDALKENVKDEALRRHVREYWGTMDTIRQTRMDSYTEG